MIRCWWMPVPPTPASPPHPIAKAAGIAHHVWRRHRRVRYARRLARVLVCTVVAGGGAAGAGYGSGAWSGWPFGAAGTPRGEATAAGSSPGGKGAAVDEPGSALVLASGLAIVAGLRLIQVNSWGRPK